MAKLINPLLYKKSLMPEPLDGNKLAEDASEVYVRLLKRGNTSATAQENFQAGVKLGILISGSRQQKNYENDYREHANALEYKLALALEVLDEEGDLHKTISRTLEEYQNFERKIGYR